MANGVKFSAIWLDILVILTGYSQVDSVLAYYPLSVGNAWQYRYIGSAVSHSYHWVRAAGDTTMPNGQTYVKLEGVKYYTVFRRVDSITANVYEYEYDGSYHECIVESLRAGVGDHFSETDCRTTTTCYASDTSSILTRKTSSKSFSVFLVPFPPKHVLAKGFGLVRAITTEDAPLPGGPISTVGDLIYAKINGEEFGQPVSVDNRANRPPTTFSLGQNYPNPFNAWSTIKYVTARPGRVVVRLFDILGREYVTLVNWYQEGGEHHVTLDASHLPSGVYLYTLSLGGFVEMKKMIIVD